jgi:DNA-binding response OmpR family regulator
MIHATGKDGARTVDMLVRPRASRGAVGPAVGDRLAVSVSAPPADGEVAVDRGARTASVAGRPVKLTGQEFDLLSSLLSRSGRVLTATQLLQEVWGYNSGVTTHTLETHIYRLRQKIEPEPGQARLLLTDAGGYRLQP